MENLLGPFLEIRDSAISIEWFRDIFYPVPHMHKEIELVYCKAGCLQCFVSNEVYEIHPGEIFVAFPNQIHNYINKEAGEYGVLIFPADVVHNLENFFFDNIPEKNSIAIENPELFDELMSKITDADGIFVETTRVGLINQLTPLYLGSVQIQSRQNTTFSSVNLQKILNYCSQNFTEDISLVSVAKHFHFSKFYISHLFNEKLNIGFKRYINCLRVNKAMDLMKKGEKSMTRIAEKSGFGSIRSFNRAFVQIATTTPYEYYKHLVETGDFTEMMREGRKMSQKSDNNC